MIVICKLTEKIVIIIVLILLIISHIEIILKLVLLLVLLLSKVHSAKIHITLHTKSLVLLLPKSILIKVVCYTFVIIIHLGTKRRKLRRLCIIVPFYEFSKWIFVHFAKVSSLIHHSIGSKSLVLLELRILVWKYINLLLLRHRFLVRKVEYIRHFIIPSTWLIWCFLSLRSC